MREPHGDVEAYGHDVGYGLCHHLQGERWRSEGVRLTAVGQPEREELVHQEPERIDVRRRRRTLSFELLGGRVRKCAREAALLLTAIDPRADSEVEHLH